MSGCQPQSTQRQPSRSKHGTRNARNRASYPRSAVLPRCASTFARQAAHRPDSTSEPHRPAHGRITTLTLALRSRVPPFDPEGRAIAGTDTRCRCPRSAPSARQYSDASARPRRAASSAPRSGAHRLPRPLGPKIRNAAHGQAKSDPDTRPAGSRCERENALDF